MKPQEWIKQRLKGRGHKLKDVALALQTTPPRITDILKGNREVQSNEVMPLAELLGISAASLLKSLSAQQLTIDPTQAAGLQLPLLGQLTGTGHVLPLGNDATLRQVAAPPDIETTEGFCCYLMGDTSMEQEIKKGSIIIAADPRKHFFPMTPGSIFLIKRPDFLIKRPENDLLIRQYHQTDNGENWLIPLPDKPNPAFSNLPLDLDPTKDKEKAHRDSVRMQDIVAGVLWVQRRYH